MLSDWKIRGKFVLKLGKGVASPLPVVSEIADLNCVPFMVVSAGRSGSTLLRAIITQHPDVCVPPESNLLGSVTRDFIIWYRYLPWAYVVRLVVSQFQSNVIGFRFWELEVGEFYQEAMQMPAEQRSLARLIDTFYMYYARDKKPGATRWGDKSFTNSRFLPWIDRLYPNAQYIHIIRDGRDVAASLIAADTVPITDIDRAANQWSSSVTATRNFGAKLDGSRYLEIHYEDLVRRPEQVIRRVNEFLGLEFSPDALDYWKNVESLGDANRKIHVNLKRPINEDSIGKWRRQLSDAEQSALQGILRKQLIEFNYSVD